ncbi:MAG: VWA domain-containing protein [Thermoanaerobaculales bacterium]|nr:VWA domain-containing protein [Thermoanaerobaculales bacterium]
MKNILSILILGCVACVTASTASAQYGGSLDVEAVVLPVTVRDSKGRVVSKVSPDRFHLRIDGIPVPIRDLHREADLPLSLGFVLDTSGSMGGRKMAACQSLVRAFLRERRAEDQLALWTFGDERVLERFPFGMSWYLLPRVLETIKPWSTTALYDMILRVPDVMERARHPRRAAILLTDGVDNASKIDPAEAARLAEGLQTPIYVLGVEPPPRKAGAEGPSYEEILALIGEASGGYYRRIPRLAQMPEVTLDLLEELSTRFILTFKTSGLGQRRWRSVEVTVDGHEVSVRKGYVGHLP